jgi:hypothetical protein
MNTRDLAVRHARRHAEIVAPELAASQQAIAKPRVFAHRETMVRRQRKDEHVAIK